MLNHIARILGRIFLSIFFLAGGYHKIMGWSGSSARIAAKGVPMASVFLGLAVAIQILGGLSLLLGYRSRAGAWLLFLFFIPTTLLFHNFWAAPPLDRQLELTEFLRNMSIMGGLLLAASAPSSKN